VCNIAAAPPGAVTALSALSAPCLNQTTEAIPLRAAQSVESRGEPAGSDLALQGLSRDVVSADIQKHRAADKEADRCFNLVYLCTMPSRASIACMWPRTHAARRLEWPALVTDVQCIQYVCCMMCALVVHSADKQVATDLVFMRWVVL